MFVVMYLVSHLLTVYLLCGRISRGHTGRSREVFCVSALLLPCMRFYRDTMLYTRLKNTPVAVAQATLFVRIGVFYVWLHIPN